MRQRSWALADKLPRGLDVPAGYVLPLARNWATGSSHSAPWKFRRERLYLVPGDSPIGLCLPILSGSPPLSIWVGSEPTFTDRLAQTPEWLHQALGGDKECRGIAGALS